MAYTLTKTAQNLVNKTNVNRNIILEIEGIPYIFGAVDVQDFWVIGDDIEIGDDIIIGGKQKSINSRPWISVSGTTSSIKQQLLQDKGGTGSVASVKIRLIDKNNELTKIFSPSDTIADIIAANADLYLGFKDGAHPTDSIKIYNGLISDTSFGAGYVDLTISHPEQLKRQELFSISESNLNGAINDSVSTITLNDASEFPLPQESISTYVRIGDEVIQYTGVSGNDLTGCVRGQLNTVAASHDDDADVQGIYRLQGQGIKLALQLLLSGSGNFSTQSAVNFNQVDDATNIPNAISFEDEDIQKTLGLVVGDLITTTGATNGANNVSNQAISGFGTTSSGSYIIVSGVSFVDEIGTAASVAFKSKYDLLNIGCSMSPIQVDVAQFESINTTFFSAIASYDFYIKEEVTAKDFIDEQILFPSGVYSLPRKGKVSCGVTAPPLETEESKELNETNILKPDTIRVMRSFNKLFYNAVVYKYEEDVLEEKYLRGNITKSERSENRIPIGNRPLTIISKGLRSTTVPVTFIEAQARRFLDRYQFGAEKITVEVNYKTGFNLEVGDTVIFGSDALKISDSTNGTRKFDQRIMEITNKQLGITKESITLELTDTAFELDGRYGTIAPSSIVDSATTTRITLSKSYSTGALNEENEKWRSYIGEEITIRSVDHTTYNQTVTLLGFETANPNVMIVDTLPSAPTGGYIVEPPIYDDASTERMARWKRAHTFFNPQVNVASGTNSTTFDVGALDADKFLEEAFIRVHNSDYSVDSGEVQVTSIVGTTIIVNNDMGFTPSSSEVVDLIGFKDGGVPYRWL